MIFVRMKLLRRISYFLVNSRFGFYNRYLQIFILILGTVKARELNINIIKISTTDVI